MFLTFPSYMSHNEKATRQITRNNDFCETPVVCRWSQTSHHAHQTSPAVPPAVLLVAECCGRGDRRSASSSDGDGHSAENSQSMSLSEASSRALQAVWTSLAPACSLLRFVQIRVGRPNGTPVGLSALNRFCRSAVGISIRFCSPPSCGYT